MKVVRFVLETYTNGYNSLSRITHPIGLLAFNCRLFLDYDTIYVTDCGLSIKIIHALLYIYIYIFLFMYVQLYIYIYIIGRTEFVHSIIM